MDGNTAGAAPDLMTSLFVDEWVTYRKMVDNNYLFHHEAYGALRRILMERARPAFRFLDVACGDASASAAMLAGTAIGSYHGLDISAEALRLAGAALANLPCPVVLEQRNFIDALDDRSLHADVVWIGLSLHHRRGAEKLHAMRAVRRIIGDDGLFAFYECTSPEGEAREGWLRRWDEQRPAWTAYTEPEWQAVIDHVHSSDFPETPSTWRELAADAGFSRLDEVYACPTDLFRLYCAQA